MIEKSKNTPLELDNTMPRELYEIIQNKWNYCFKMEKEIRESTLAQVMPNLTRGQITKANKKHCVKFAPKYRTFSILQNKIEEVVQKSIRLWKSIYNITDDKDGQEEEDAETNKAKASEKEKEDTIDVEETRKG